MPLETDQANDDLNIKLIKLNIYSNQPWRVVFCFLPLSLESFSIYFNHNYSDKLLSVNEFDI